MIYPGGPPRSRVMYIYKIRITDAAIREASASPHILLFIPSIPAKRPKIAKRTATGGYGKQKKAIVNKIGAAIANPSKRLFLVSL